MNCLPKGWRSDFMQMYRLVFFAVKDYLGADHTEVLFTKQDIFDSLSILIYNIETYDITTIRASMGMFLVSKYISENTDIKVLMTGEISDEIFGYKYTDLSPTSVVKGFSYADSAYIEPRKGYMICSGESTGMAYFRFTSWASLLQKSII